MISCRRPQHLREASIHRAVPVPRVLRIEATMMQYMVEQGVLKEALPVDDLFVPVEEFR
jgi:hypothetical protein